MDQEDRAFRFPFSSIAAPQTAAAQMDSALGFLVFGEFLLALAAETWGFSEASFYLSHLLYLAPLVAWAAYRGRHYSIRTYLIAGGFLVLLNLKLFWFFHVLPHC